MLLFGSAPHQAHCCRTRGTATQPFRWIQAAAGSRASVHEAVSHSNHCQEPHLTGAGKYCDSSRLQELVSGGVFNHLKSANHKLEVLVTNTCVINVSFRVNGSCAGPTLVLCHTAGSRPNKFKINLLTKISYFYLVLLIFSLRQYLPIQSDRS